MQINIYINIVTHGSCACICIFPGLEASTNFTRHYIIKKKIVLELHVTRFKLYLYVFTVVYSKKKQHTHILNITSNWYILHRPCYSFYGLCYMSLSVYKSYTTKKKTDIREQSH